MEEREEGRDGVRREEGGVASVTRLGENKTPTSTGDASSDVFRISCPG